MIGQEPKAILLDLDDTIIAFDHGIDTDACWREAIQSYAEEDENHRGVLLSRIKVQAKWFWSDPERHRLGRQDLVKARQTIIAECYLQLEREDGGRSGRIAASYSDLRDEAIRLFPDSIGVLRLLRQRGIKLALLTNGNANGQWGKVHRFELESYFDSILIEGDLGIGKPDVRIYQYALELLGVAPNEAWMVGDNFEWEVAAPQRLGIAGIWLDHKQLGHPSTSSVQPHKIIRSLGDLPALLE
jgi:putative hydrolase of the HAD superfamily